MPGSARQIHINGLDKTPRSVKRRKLGTEDDGFHGSTIIVKTTANLSTPTTTKRGRGTPRNVPVSLSQDLQALDDAGQISVDAGLPNGHQEPRKNESTGLSSEGGATRQDTTNGDVMRTPHTRKGGRAPRVSSSQAVRLSDLIRREGNDVPMEDEITTSTPLTRQSGRERRRPRRYSDEIVPIEMPNLLNGLSVRKGKGGRPRKAATFKDVSLSQTTDQLGFKEIEHEERIGQSEPVWEDIGTGEVVGTSKDITSEKIPLKRRRGRVKKGNTTDGPSKGRHEQSDPVEEFNGIEQNMKDPQPPLKRKRREAREIGAMETLHESGNERSIPGEKVDRMVESVETLRDVNYLQSQLRKGHARSSKAEVSGRGTMRQEEPAEVPQSTIDPTEEDVITVGQGNSVSKDLFSRFTNDPETEQALFSIKTILLVKLTGKRRLPLVGVEGEYKKVYQTVSQTVLAGEGNSLLVIGARGSGKSTLVETVIDDLSADHATNFHTVRLNGFIHTDDKLAIKEIWRQLGREMEVEEEGLGTTTNHADILSSLLALLSHPSELSTETKSDETAKAVIFILDEFDLFASHPRQTLLYNLFDIAQARKAPVAVLGLTTKIGVVESLEKRVKSRFSHRYVHISLPKSLESFWEICQQALIITEEEIIELEKAGNTISDLLITAWNQSIQDLPTRSSALKHLLQQTFALSKLPQDVFTSLLHPLISLTPSNLPFSLPLPLNPLLFYQPPSSNLHLLPSLTDLQLSLLISAARLEHILNTDTCTFHMVYDEYVRLASRTRASYAAMATGVANPAAGSARVWGKEIAKTAWEGLVELGLVVPAVGVGVTVAAAQAGAGATMWKVDVALDEIPLALPGLSAMLAKWCRELS